MGKTKITLRAARHNAGMTQREAAELLGVIPLTVSDWEVGKYKPVPERRSLIAAVYGVPQDFIEWGDRREGEED